MSAPPGGGLAARLRSGHGATVGRTLAMVVPAMLFVVCSGVGTFALSGELGAGILVLVLLFAPLYIGAVVAARRLDFGRDGRNPRVRVEADAVLLPLDGQVVRLPRAGLVARPGYYSHRVRDRSTPFATGGSGVFLHLRGGGVSVVLLADDQVGDAPARGIQRYKDPPADLPTLRVWSRELLPIIAALAGR